MMNDQSLLTEFLGVDVSKGKLDFAFADGKETWSIDNAQPPVASITTIVRLGFWIRPMSSATIGC